MILFAVYALVVWYLALRWRRTIRGFVAVLLGTALSLALTKLVWLLTADRPTPASLPNPSPIALLLVAESLLVLGGGLFIASLPRPPSGRHCRHCWYDLVGLDEGPLICPECGEKIPAFHLESRPAPPSNDPATLNATISANHSTPAKSWRPSRRAPDATAAIPRPVPPAPQQPAHDTR